MTYFLISSFRRHGRARHPGPDESGDRNFLLLGRSYNARRGYDVGGTGGPLNISWADIRTYDLDYRMTEVKDVATGSILDAIVRVRSRQS